MLPPTHPALVLLAADVPSQVPTYLVLIGGALVTLAVLCLWTRQAIAVVLAAVCGVVLATASGVTDDEPAPASSTVVRELGR